MNDFKVEYLKKVERINRRIEHTLDLTKERASDLGESLQEYYNILKDYVAEGGKRLRPTLAVCVYEAVKGETPPDEIVDTVLALEFLHTASLIHDDIMDHDDVRRGKPAFHAQFKKKAQTNGLPIPSETYGLAMGILGGDAVYNLAYQALLSPHITAEKVLQISQVFNTIFRDIVEGVIMEMEFISMEHVSEDRYYEMIARKTGALFVGAAKIGAILAGASESQIEGIVRYAANMGRAFQIIDDVLGSFGDEKKTGKPTDGDIREGKKTLLLIRALDKASPEQLKSLKELVGNPEISADQVQQVRDIFEDTGARESVVLTAEELIEDGRQSLSNVEPALDPMRVNQLLALAEMGVHRTK